MISKLRGSSDSDVYLFEYEYAKTPVLWKRVSNLAQLLHKCVHIRSSILRCRYTSVITHADAANTFDSICRRVEHELNKLMGLVIFFALSETHQAVRGWLDTCHRPLSCIMIEWWRQDHENHCKFSESAVLSISWDLRMRWPRLTNLPRTRFEESEIRPYRYNAMRRDVAVCYWYMLRSRIDLNFTVEARELPILGEGQCFAAEETAETRSLEVTKEAVAFERKL
jgi:hypothetical protein